MSEPSNKHVDTTPIQSGVFNSITSAGSHPIVVSGDQKIMGGSLTTTTTSHSTYFGAFQANSTNFESSTSHERRELYKETIYEEPLWFTFIHGPQESDFNAVSVGMTIKDAMRFVLDQNQQELARWFLKIHVPGCNVYHLLAMIKSVAVVRDSVPNYEGVLVALYHELEARGLEARVLLAGLL